MLTHFLPDSANSRNLQIRYCSPADAPCLVPALILTQPRAIVKKNFQPLMEKAGRTPSESLAMIQ